MGRFLFVVVVGFLVLVFMSSILVSVIYQFLFPSMGTKIGNDIAQTRIELIKTKTKKHRNNKQKNLAVSKCQHYLCQRSISV